LFLRSLGRHARGDELNFPFESLAEVSGHDGADGRDEEEEAEGVEGDEEAEDQGGRPMGAAAAHEEEEEEDEEEYAEPALQQRGVGEQTLDDALNELEALQALDELQAAEARRGL